MEHIIENKLFSIMEAHYVNNENIYGNSIHVREIMIINQMVHYVLRLIN